MITPASSIIDNSTFTVQAARDFMAALQAQDQPSSTSVDFTQALESSRSALDIVEVGTVGQAANADPTASPLFQAHLGAFSVTNVLTSSSDLALGSEPPSQLKINGINASVAPGPFANEQAPQSEDFRTGLATAKPSQFPAAAGAGDFTSTYNALRTAGQMNPPVGIQMDFKG
jgi:hypothetical protein